ncbi:permease-like cell division protein FtsX [Cellulomonas bogoriensis]|uniref:Cell division protein FtsX n=1 Tax=Cellulomonas bogoriensis 69B4 = DSM 16987 TaxID=1386082 RepID=A0A0A0BZB3_9CELL|nr:permease-like cell division protein FtsX [Cellulomonas bogoriensis]KGM13270.1 cell division protein FtsX [Cellulomonas bogoriensis 69B4 = DSM 16987]
MRLQFILSEIGIGLRRNLSMAVSVILVTFVSLTFVGAAGLLQLQIDAMKDDWYDRVEVTIYLCPEESDAATCAAGETTEEQTTALWDELNSEALDPYVAEAFYESQEDAFAAFQERFADEWWAQGLTADQMQASFRVSLVDPAQYQVVADMFTGRQGVEDVRDPRAVVEPLILVMNRLSLVAAGIAGVMLLAAVLLITTTIRLSAMSRRRETGIMRLVGASNLFIQLPFMLEGAIAATIGAALSVAGLWFGVHYLVEDWLAQSIQFIPYVGTDEVWLLAPALVGIAILLATISSVVTLSRYTKV